MHRFNFSTVTTHIDSWKVWEYWQPTNLLATAPNPSWPWMWWFVGLIGLCLAAGLASLFIRFHDRLRHRLSTLFLNNVWIGAILFFLRYERLPILGMDLWRLIQEITLFVWLALITRDFRRDYPKERLAARIVEYRAKYLPKPKSTH
jgi:hypothetical protein